MKQLKTWIVREYIIVFHEVEAFDRDDALDRAAEDRDYEEWTEKVTARVKKCKEEKTKGR